MYLGPLLKLDKEAWARAFLGLEGSHGLGPFRSREEGVGSAYSRRKKGVWALARSWSGAGGVGSAPYWSGRRRVVKKLLEAEGPGEEAWDHPPFDALEEA